MILGLYFVIVSAYLAAWFVSQSGIKRPDEMIKETCCNPGLLLPRGVIDWLGMQVEMDHCGQIWCVLGVFFVLYFGWVMMISWLLEIALFSSKADGFGWGLLLYLLVELIIGVFYCFHRWIVMVRNSHDMLKRYRTLKNMDPETATDALKAERDGNES